MQGQGDCILADFGIQMTENASAEAPGSYDDAAYWARVKALGFSPAIVPAATQAGRPRLGAMGHSR